MQALPGFRDFFPEECARRNYIFARWREVARRYGFVEYDGPVLEPIDLYRKKSGGELVGQLFEFIDKGERHVALRPEMTPTLARMVAARARDFRKPIKWFSIAQFFRYEKQQRGRLREFYQLNADIFGDDSPGADAEMISLAIDMLRSFGFTAEDFVVRVSDRRAWNSFLAENRIETEAAGEFLQVIDKLDPNDSAATEQKLAAFGVSAAKLNEFLNTANQTWFEPLRHELDLRGLAKFTEFDLRIVRGLAYYTGLVFEIFDRSGKLRALAGGGRYDNLIEHLSDGATSISALGFAMGDVVLGELLTEHTTASESMEKWIRAQNEIDIYIVIAKEDRRADALRLGQQLRDAGWRVDYPLGAAKVGKQFQSAGHLNARVAVVVGEEWPDVNVKALATGEQRPIAHAEVTSHLATLLQP
jgi:histidyl-tRNA synthetase